MAVSDSGVASPSGSSITSLERVADEREFDRPASMIPDSQPNPDHVQLKLSPKFVSIPDEVSEEALAAGFAFSHNAPPRPGQYTHRPNRIVPTLPTVASHPERKKPVSLVTHSSPHHRNMSAKARQNAVPLDLPELGLPAMIASNRSPGCQQAVQSGDSSRHLPFPLATSPDTFSSPNTPKFASNSPFSADNGLLRPSRPQPLELDSNLKPSPSSRSMKTLSRVPQRSIHPPARVGELGSSKYFPAKGQSDRESQFNDLKIPMPNVTQMAQAQAQAQAQARDRISPVRMCGDLERPSPQTPRTHRRTPRNHTSARSTRKFFSPHTNEQPAASRDRSHSRTSNISRKRSAVDKHRSRTDPERKQTAMHQVAQYWNECMQIAADERDEANGEIEMLQSQIHKQGKELNMSVQLLSEKKAELQNTESRCKKLEDQEIQVKANNQRLNDELKTLRDEISESKKRTTTFGDKSRIYKAKLNEAIAEQQALFIRSRDLYKECQEELQKEKSSRAAQALEIDKALDESLKKREDLKQCFQEYRSVAEQENNTKAIVIEQLRTKMEEREAEVVREKETVVELRHHINEQTKVYKSVERLEARVQNLVDARLKSKRQHEDNEMAAIEVSTKLDDIMKHLQTSADQASPPIDFEPIVKDLEENIIAKVLPILLTVMSAQSQAKGSISKLRTDVTTELEGIKKAINGQKSELSLGRETQTNMRCEIRESLENLGSVMKGAQQGCESAGLQMTESFDRQTKKQENILAFLQTEVTRQFKEREEQITERESKIFDLQQKLQLSTDAYASRVTSMGNSISNSNEVANKQLQDALSAIHDTLEKGFEKEKSDIERSLSQSEEQCATLQAQVEEEKRKLAVVRNTLTNTDNSQLRQSLVDERQAVISLTAKLTQYELAAKESSQLHDRWLRDIQAIDVLRGQLKHVTERLPHVNALGGQLQDMVTMNNMMRTTAGYLNDERRWVQEQLKSKVQSVASTIPAPPAIIKLSQTELGDLSAHMPTSSHREVVSTEPRAQKEDLLPKPESQDSQANDQRKVHVYSPAVGIRSPSPAMTIQEEQQRRREGITPRSILKSSQSSSQEAFNEDLPPKIPPNQSQYNRPVMSQPASKGTGVSDAMVKQIRAHLLQQRETGLITVVDFQKTIQQSKGQSMATYKRKVSTDVAHTQDPNVKRMKAEESSSQGDNEALRAFIHQDMLTEAKHSMKRIVIPGGHSMNLDTREKG